MDVARKARKGDPVPSGVLIIGLAAGRPPDGLADAPTTYADIPTSILPGLLPRVSSKVRGYAQPLSCHIEMLGHGFLADAQYDVNFPALCSKCTKGERSAIRRAGGPLLPDCGVALRSRCKDVA